MPNYILNNENAILYECGYTCDNALFLSIGKYKYFITDARYDIEARASVKSGIVVICAFDLCKQARLILRKHNVSSIKFDSTSFSLHDFQRLKQGIKTRLVEVTNLSQKMREVKDKDALLKLKEAAKIGECCFDEFASFIKSSGEGKSEKYLHKKAVEIFSDFGDRNLSFSPIFAINANAAKAHALPSDTILKRGDLILLDAGVRYEGYCSDRTRTACFDEGFSFSKKQSFKNAKTKEIYDLVLKAQQAAISTIRPGIRASLVDKAARDVIALAGYKEQFFHSTGHGVGLDIHELPRINLKSDTILKEGMVFSVEPGVYLEGEFGVRIEDVVAVTSDGCEVL